MRHYWLLHLLLILWLLVVLVCLLGSLGWSGRLGCLLGKVFRFGYWSCMVTLCQRDKNIIFFRYILINKKKKKKKIKENRKKTPLSSPTCGFFDSKLESERVHASLQRHLRLGHHGKGPICKYYKKEDKCKREKKKKKKPRLTSSPPLCSTHQNQEKTLRRIKGIDKPDLLPRPLKGRPIGSSPQSPSVFRFHVLALHLN